MAERRTRIGRMSRVHKPATMRSEDRRLGARFRPRFRIRSCCRIKTDSATTQRRPPGVPSRMMVTIAYRKRVKMSRMRGWYQTEQAQEFRMLAEFAYHTDKRKAGMCSDCST